MRREAANAQLRISREIEEERERERAGKQGRGRGCGSRSLLRTIPARGCWMRAPLPFLPDLWLVD